MKKNILFIIYLMAVIIIMAIKFKPDYLTIFFIATICILKFAGKTLISFDQSEKKQLFTLKTIFILIINVFALASLFLVTENTLYKDIEGDTPGIKMLFYSIFFSSIGLDFYIIYSYLFERNKESLIS